MGELSEAQRSLLADRYIKMDSGGNFVAGRFLGPLASEEARKEDITDSFFRFRDAIGLVLRELGIEDPVVVDHMTMRMAMLERAGFESGVKFVHDNAVVTTEAEAARQASFARNVVGNWSG